MGDLMKYILLFTASISASAAQWCDVKSVKTGAVLHTYEGLCDQRKFGGTWGDPALTIHAVNLVKQKEIDDAAAAQASREAVRAARIARIRTQCASAVGLVKEICDQILDN
jgi:hypothetical protein